MRGWVYVMTNQGMPGLVKVGYTDRDPKLRAKELSHTGVAFDFKVDYEALVNNASQVERDAHRQLSAYHANKEFFSCDVNTAVAAVRKSCGANQIFEINNSAANSPAVFSPSDDEKSESSELPSIAQSLAGILTLFAIIGFSSWLSGLSKNPSLALALFFAPFGPGIWFVAKLLRMDKLLK